VTELVVGALQRAGLQAGVLALAGAAAWGLVVRPGLVRSGVGVGAGAGPIAGDGASDPGFPDGSDRESTRNTSGSAPTSTAHMVERRVLRLAAFTALAMVPFWLIRLHVQMTGFRDPFVPLMEDLELLVMRTPWGRGWRVQGVLFAVLAAGLLPFAARRPPAVGDARPRPWIWVALAAGTLLFALSLTLSSHAMAVQQNRALAIGADLLHILAAGAWIGTLGVILSAGRSPSSTHDPLLAEQLRRFSPMALTAVALLLVLGVVLSVQHVTTLAALWREPYGRILSLKLLVVSGALALGFANWRRGMPGIDAGDVQGEVRRRATWELALVGIVLLLTGLLTGTVRPPLH